MVNMYLGLAESLPPCRRVPNWPRGWSMFKLLLPTKFWARPTMVIIRETWGIEKHLNVCIMWKLPGSLVLYNSHDSSLIDMLAQFYFWMCIFIFIMGQCLAKNKSNVTRFFIYRLNNKWWIEKSPHLSMVVCWHFSHWSSQLSHFHLSLIIPLKTAEKHFPLAWF